MCHAAVAPCRARLDGGRLPGGNAVGACGAGRCRGDARRIGPGGDRRAAQAGAGAGPGAGAAGRLGRGERRDGRVHHRRRAAPAADERTGRDRQQGRQRRRAVAARRGAGHAGRRARRGGVRHARPLPRRAGLQAHGRGPVGCPDAVGRPGLDERDLAHGAEPGGTGRAGGRPVDTGAVRQPRGRPGRLRLPRRRPGKLQPLPAGLREGAGLLPAHPGRRQRRRRAGLRHDRAGAAQYLCRGHVARVLPGAGAAQAAVQGRGRAFQPPHEREPHHGQARQAERQRRGGAVAGHPAFRAVGGAAVGHAHAVCAPLRPAVRGARNADLHRDDLRCAVGGAARRAAGRAGQRGRAAGDCVRAVQGGVRQAQRAAQAAAPAAPAAVSDLPVIEVAAQPGTSSELFAVLLSGDGGWAGLDKEVAAALSKSGVPVVGVDSLRYFWTPRTPASRRPTWTAWCASMPRAGRRRRPC